MSASTTSRPATATSSTQQASSPSSTSSSSSTSHPQPDTLTATTPQLPLHNPIPLTASQEAQVRDLYHRAVRAKCAAEIRDFAHCAVNRTISATWACRTQRLAMNSCMIAHATRAEEDRAREQWFAEIPVRARAREDEARRNEVERRKHHEWWGLDEQGRRVWKEGADGREGGSGEGEKRR